MVLTLALSLQLVSPLAIYGNEPNSYLTITGNQELDELAILDSTFR
jgi:hypothetical protein